MTFDDIEGLSGYRGLTPLPADFDSFWEARMAEADAVALEWSICPSNEVVQGSGCSFLDLWFQGMGGAKLYAKVVRPNVEGPLPVVLQFHGYPGATRSWFEQSSFAGMGMMLVAMDNPGQGGKSEDVGGYQGTTVAGHLVAGLDGPLEDLYYVRLYQDVRILCRIVRELGAKGLADLSRVYVNGASQGGGMGVACCALNPDLVAKAAILYPFLSDFRKVYELGADEVAYEGIRYYARWFDPSGEREDEWFGKLAYIETNHFAHLVRCPVLFGTGLADTICPPQTQCAVYNELSCPKERHLFPGFGHEEIQDFDDLIIDFFDGRVCSYETLSVPTSDGATQRLRHVVPPVQGPRPALLLLSGGSRTSRGWHHVTRYAGVGFELFHRENRPGVGAQSFTQAVEDALACFDAVAATPGVDASKVVVYGEGLGGALALAVAAQRPVAKAGALNPYPAKPLLTAVGSISCPVLLGTSRMDEVAPAEEQDLLARDIAHLTRKNYPKYAHERINAFENELLSFVNSL